MVLTFLIKLSALMHLIGMLCYQMGNLCGFSRDVIVLMAGIETTLMAINNEAVDDMIKGTPIQKDLVTIMSIIIRRILILKRMYKSKDKGVRKEYTIFVSLGVNHITKGFSAATDY